MNVYDEAHKLARAVKESQEYITYMNLKAEVEKDAELCEQIRSLEAEQLKLQASLLMNHIDENESEKNGNIEASIQKLTETILQKPLAAQYLNAQLRFSNMMNDVYKILADLMGIGI